MTTTEATVTKRLMETYIVRNNYEYATIALRCWENTNEKTGVRTYYGGEIMINSTFGSWANVWGACGSPFKEFLQEIEFDYAFGKFMSSSLEIFDGDSSLHAVKETVLEARRTGRLDKEEARELFDELEYIDTYSEEDFVHSCQRIAGEWSKHPLRDTFMEAWDLIRRQPDPQATGFWRDIWPHFIAELAKETTK